MDTILLKNHCSRLPINRDSREEKKGFFTFLEEKKMIFCFFSCACDVLAVYPKNIIFLDEMSLEKFESASVTTTWILDREILNAHINPYYRLDFQPLFGKRAEEQRPDSRERRKSSLPILHFKDTLANTTMKPLIPRQKIMR